MRVWSNPNGYTDNSDGPFIITSVALTTTKIGIYNGGNWYIDYNGDGQFTGKVISIFPMEQPAGHNLSGTGMEMGRAR